MATRSRGRPKSVSYFDTHLTLTKHQKRAVTFLVALPGLAHKIIGSPRRAKTIWETKICISHEYGPNPIDHSMSLWITQCWKNAPPFFSDHFVRSIEKFALDDTRSETILIQIKEQIPAIVDFYHFAQKMRKQMFAS